VRKKFSKFLVNFLFFFFVISPPIKDSNDIRYTYYNNGQYGTSVKSYVAVSWCRPVITMCVGVDIGAPFGE
jgi:hypothetical protein